MFWSHLDSNGVTLLVFFILLLFLYNLLFIIIAFKKAKALHLEINHWKRAHADYSDRVLDLAQQLAGKESQIKEMLEKKPPKEESYEVKELLQDLLGGKALIAVHRVDPASVFLRSTREWAQMGSRE